MLHNEHTMKFKRTLNLGFFQQPFSFFWITGLAIFVLDHAINDSFSQPEPWQKRIEITAGIKKQLKLKFERVWQRSPTAAETQGYLEDFIRNVWPMLRKSWGFDRSDEVVTRRLRQKMELVFRASAMNAEPTRSQLQRLEAHQADFSQQVMSWSKFIWVN